jgi:voltage-gated potassium channel
MPQSADAVESARPGGGEQPVSKPQSQRKPVAVSAALVALITLAYYLIPVPGPMRKSTWAVLFGCGVIALGVLIAVAVRRLLRRASEDVRLRGLVLLLVLTVMFFSYADRSVAELPGQFAELQNKTDALYFNVSTLATVGFGDVHPVGQLARSAVTLQIVFNLVFIGTAVAMITGALRIRARGRMQTPGTEHRDTGEHRVTGEHRDTGAHGDTATGGPG